jgi:hypothetical protein
MPRKSPRIEPEFKYDFTLYLSIDYDEIKDEKFLKFLIETTQHFVAFSYELNVEVQKEDNQLTFLILGFKPPSSPISQFGPARFEYRIYRYKEGIYKITVVKKEKIKNSFQVLITDDKIKVKSEPRKNKFVKIKVS